MLSCTICIIIGIIILTIVSIIIIIMNISPQVSREWTPAGCYTSSYWAALSAARAHVSCIAVSSADMYVR